MKQVKTIRPRNWLYELLVCLELFLIVGIWWIFCGSWQFAFAFGGFSYITLAWTLRLTLQRHHRKGMKFLRRKQYEQAAASFRSSYQFFTDYPWIDRYRFVTMFNSNAIPFQQMALNNQGICCLHLGKNKEALEAFQKLAELNGSYPNIRIVIEEIQKHINKTEHS